MRNVCLFAVALMLLVASAWAQPSPSFQGTWVGNMVGITGNQLNVEMNLSDSGGTFRQRPSGGNGGRGNPCFGKEFPVTLSVQSATEATIEINGGKVLAGCIDASVSLKALDGKSLENTFKDGRVMKLSRQ